MCWPGMCGQGPPPGLACRTLTRRTRRASSLRTPLPLSPAHARGDTLTCTHLLNSGSDGLHADGTNEAQTCGGDPGSHQLFVIEPKAAPSSQGLSRHPAVPGDPGGRQGLRPKWPRRLTLPRRVGTEWGVPARRPLTPWPLQRQRRRTLTSLMRCSGSGPDSGPHPWDAFHNYQLPWLFFSFCHFFFFFFNRATEI